MKMIKDKVVKDIPENLVPTYTSIGWKVLTEEKPKVTFSKPKFVNTEFTTENNEN